MDRGKQNNIIFLPIQICYQIVISKKSNINICCQLILLYKYQKLTMKAPSLLGQSLTLIQNCLNLKSEYQNRIFYFDKNSKQEEQSLKLNYYASIGKNIMITKIKIDQFLKKIKNDHGEKPIVLEQKNALKILQKKLAALDIKVDILMKEGILQLYMDLCELSEKVAKSSKINPLIVRIITFIIQSLHNLLRNFFVLVHYQNKQEFKEQDERKSLLSLKELKVDEVNKDKMMEEEKQFKSIEDKVYSMSIDSLIDDYVKFQEKSIRQRKQICRICQNPIKLDHMSRHVKYCQSKCQLKSKIDIKNTEMAQIIKEIKSQYELICEKDSKSLLDQNFKRTAKIILAQEKKKSKTKIRRSSLVVVKSQKCIQNTIENCIEQFEYQNGENAQFHRILQIHRDLVYLQKKLTNLQLNYENQASDSRDSKNSNNENSHSQSSSYKINLIYINQFHDNIKQNSENMRMQEKIASNLSIRMNELSIKDLVKRQSDPKTYNILKDLDGNKRSCAGFQKIEMGDIIKHYVSLQDIVLEEQKEEIHITLDNFTVLKFLGQGAFGKVYLVKKNQTDNLYAMKIIKMKETNSNEQFQTIKNQHEIFKQIAGEHLVTASFSFNENDTQFFIMEYLPGGDLRKMLNQEVYFQEKKAKFYLAQIVLAIEHLHNFSIIHRDLKPENLVIDKNGHLKLTDFGLSEYQIQKKIEICSKLQEQQKNLTKRSRKRRTAIMHSKKRQNLIGTPDYIAPEIINHVSINNFTIDWWSLGVITYELLIGTRPFTAQTVEEVINNIIDLQLQWPEDNQEISPEGKDLIQKLLNRDFINRLGANGAQQIKDHPFFQGIDWDNIKKQKPPTIPKVSHLQFQMHEENEQLTKEIKKFIGKEEQNPIRKEGKKKTLKLQKFVRFDILGNETIQNVEKVLHQKTSRLQKLKSISKFECKHSFGKQIQN